MRTKHLLIIATAGSLLFLGPLAQAKTKILFAGGGNLQMFAPFFEKFQKKYPNIVIQYQPDFYGEKAWLQLAAGFPADVMMLNGFDAQAFIQAGAIEPLDKYIKSSNMSLKDFIPESLSPYKAQGQLYGLPYDWCPMLTFFNRSHLKAAGIPNLSANMTFDDLALFARKLKVQNDTRVTRWGLTTWLGNWPFEGTWLRPFGGSMFNDDETQVEITSKESVKAMTFAQNLWAEKLIGGSFPTTASMAIDGTWSFGNFAKLKEDWDVAPLPKGPVQQAGSASGSGFGIVKYSKHKKEAWIFLNELTGAMGSELIWYKYTTPARYSALKRFYDQFSKVNSKAIDYAFDHSIVGRPLKPPGHFRIMDRVNPILGKLMALQMSPEQTAQKIKSEIEVVWQRSRKKR